MALTGVVSGTKVIVSIAGTPLQGEVSHSFSDTLEAIDITNKTDADVRSYLEGEGRRLLDLTIESISNSGAQVSALYAAYDTKTSIVCARTVGTRTVSSAYMVTGISDNPSLNAAVNDSFTLSSTGAITVS